MAKHEQPDKGWREWVLKTLPTQMETSMAAAGFEPGPRDPQPFSVPMSLAASYDVIERLPPGAADRLRALRQRFRDLNLVIPKHDQIHELSTTRIQAEQRLKRLTDHQQNGGFHLDPATDPRVLEQQRLLDKLTDDLRRLHELSEVRSATWHAASHVLSAVEGWLKDGVPPGVVLLEDIEGKPPQLLKNETVIDAIERHRRRGRELKADLHRIQSAPYGSAHARAKIKQEIEALATRGVPVVSDVIEHDGSVIWPMQRLQGAIVNAQAPSFTVTEVPDVLGLFAAVHKTALLAYVDALVTEEADDAAALSATERETRAAVVVGDLLACEYDEARLVWQAQADKLPCEHRSDCAPQAILQVRLETAPRVEATGTTPGYSWDLRR
jgi:hypothetical protein